ncbi:MAG: cytidine deaminase [Caldilineales bacterium]
MLNQATIADLIHQAAAARQAAYVPYSHFAVGAALLTASGRVYRGCNIENASYGLTVCAERVAIWRAVADGETEFAALAVVTDIAASPCGACRQVMAEFSAAMPVYMADLNGNYSEITVDGLLPLAFRSEHLAQAAEMRAA